MILAPKWRPFGCQDGPKIGKKNDPKNIKKILTDKNESAFQAASTLKKRNLNVGKAKASILFSEDSKAGEKVNLVSKDKCTCIFSAPGSAMKIDEQNPPTDLLLMVKRSKPNKYKINQIFLSLL